MSELSQHTAEGLPSARLIAAGPAALMQGFSLIGFETLPDATPAQLDALLEDVLRRRETALVVLESHLAQCDCPALARVRRSGGSIVVVEVPALHTPDDYHLPVEQLVASVLGQAALEESL